VIATVTELVTVTLALLVFEGSAALATSTTAGLGLGTDEGAVYLHVQGDEVVQAVKMPWVELPFFTPFTYQFNAVSVVPLIVAVNTCEAPKAMLALDGLRPTAMLSVTVTLAVLVLLGSAPLATSTTAGFGLGTAEDGAV
jgi:hypothetical protein